MTTAPSKLANWQLVLQAIHALGGRASVANIRDYFLTNFPDRNISNIRPDATSITVNANSRVYYAGGKQPRRTDSGNQYDRLFLQPDHHYVIYDPALHGVWEIKKDQQGVLRIEQANAPSDVQLTEVDHEISMELESEPSDSSLKKSQFAMEAHLRDFLAQNLDLVKGIPASLSLYSDETSSGVEYGTSVGRIDILAQGSDSAFYVLELKLGRSADVVIGQIMRYMGWVKVHLAKGRPVYGIVVLSEASEKLRYAALATSGIYVMEYQIQFSMKPAEEIAIRS